MRNAFFGFTVGIVFGWGSLLFGAFYLGCLYLK